MGRLDDAAKCKVVELRKAGLSFRKIKAVLELENIKVSAQAIYYFLREFQGRPPGRVRPLEAGSSTSSAPLQSRAGPSQDSWSLQSLRRGVSHHAGFAGLSNFAKQSLTCRNSSAGTSGSGEIIGSSRLEQQQKEDKEENDIQIVSVTSLAQSSQQINLPPAVTGAETSTVSTNLVAGAPVRRRVPVSSATRSMLAARRRLLDKALSQRMKQVVSSQRRDHVSPHSADQRNAVSQPSESYDLTTEPTDIKGQPGGQRRFLSQRPALPARPPQSFPRVGIRLPNHSHSPLAQSAPRVVPVRLQTPSSQAAPRGEGGASPHQASLEVAGRGGLQDHIQSLGCEVRSLGLAVKMLVEQQIRLEKEQVQQTVIQRQILSTLQSLASKVGSCTGVQQQQQHHRSKTPSPSRIPLLSASMSVSQDAFGFSRGTYAECSRAQASYNSLEGLEGVEAFKLPELSPSSMNGFPPCSSDNGTLPITHTSSQTQQYTAAYQQQGAQTLATAFVQPFASAYDESQSQTFRGSESKMTDFTGSCSSRSLPDCSVSAQQQDQQISAIKVEGP